MRAISLFFLSIITVGASAQGVRKPRLVVNVVVSQLRYDDLVRYGDKFTEGGFNRFLREGMTFTESEYDYMQTTTPAGLATLTTGANPSAHGVVNAGWYDYVNNKPVSLADDPSVSGLECDAGVGRCSPLHVVVPTLGDRLKEESPRSKVVTVASDPVSAVVMGGQTSDVYWMDTTRCTWISSTAYMRTLPDWVVRYNGQRLADTYLDYEWKLLNHRESYRNESYSVIDFEPESRFRKIAALGFLRRKEISRDYARIPHTPAGITLVKDFAKQAVIYEDLGKDEHADLLNICFDTPRYIGSAFGGGSMEREDMLYRMDTELADLLDFIYAQVPEKDVLVVLTSDHGVSDPFDAGARPRERFNAAQFRVIVNGFLCAQYGSGEWVVGYRDRQLYLNRTLIYSQNLSLEEVQNRTAAFALQFRGVSHALTATALSGGSFAEGYGKRMQNSFYPKRSGDVLINLMPGWIEEDEQARALSGSLYDYDTHVPLMWLGAGIPACRVRAPADMRDVAPTLARILRITRPVASEGKPIEALVSLLEE